MREHITLNTTHIVPAAPEPQRGTGYNSGSAQLTSPLLGLPDIGPLSRKRGRGAKIHHKCRDFSESQTPPNPVDGPGLLCTACAAALPTVKMGGRLEKGFRIYLWTSQTVFGARRWWEGATVHTELVLLAVGFFYWDQSSLLCKKNSKKTPTKPKITTHKKTNPAVPYLKCKHFSIMNANSWLNTKHSFPEGEGMYSNTVSGIKPPCPHGIWHLKVPWNSGIISHITGIAHHSPPQPEKSLHWNLRHHTPKRKSKPNLNFYQFLFMIWWEIWKLCCSPHSTEWGDRRLWFKGKIQDLRNPRSLLSQNTTAIPGRLLRAQLNTALNQTLNSH